MKNLFLIFLLAVLFLSCESKDPKIELRVGMTYNEVDSILGKPISIVRGQNQMEMLDDSETVLAINADSTYDIGGYERWFFPKELVKIDKQYYITWVYEETKVDTNYSVVNSYRYDFNGNNELLRIIDKVTTHFYEITYNKSIVFDVASGRVIKSGEYPTKLVKISKDVVIKPKKAEPEVIFN